MNSISQVLKLFEEKKFKPVYLLLGKEKFFHDQIIQSLSDDLFSDASSRGLNRILLHGIENSLAEIVSASLSYPMMSQFKLVIVKDFNKIKMADSDSFLRYLEYPQKSTILVISSEESANNKIFNALKDHSVLVDCKPIPEYKTAHWIKERVMQKGLQMSSGALSMFAEYTGNSLLTIEHEISKIIEYKSNNSEITKDEVIAVTGMSKEYNVFSFQKALGDKDLNRCFKIGKKLIDSGENVNLILVIMFNYFKKVLIVYKSANNLDHLKINDFQRKQIMVTAKNFNQKKIENILNLLNELDRNVKNSIQSDWAVIQTLCYNICRL